MIPWALPGPSAGTHLDPPWQTADVLSVDKLFLSPLVQRHHDAETFQNQPHLYTAGTGDKPSGCRLCKLGTHFLPIASRPSSCQSPAKEQAQSSLKNHFAILRLVAISTAETGSTWASWSRSKSSTKRPNQGWSISNSLIISSHHLLSWLILPQK